MIDGPRRAPASGGPAKQLVVFVHGYGADGADLIGLAEQLGAVLPDAEFVAPDAPDPVPEVPSGRQWFPLSMRDMDEMSRGARAAAPALDEFLDAELARTGLSDANLALIGFSQGTMLSLFTGLRRKEAPALIVGFSGGLPDAASTEAELRCKPPVFLAHGEADTVVMYTSSIATAQVLAGLGLGVAVHLTPNLPHTIGPDAFRIAAGLLAEAFAGTLRLPPGAHKIESAPPGA